MQVSQYFERLVRAVWERHYAIPEPVYWAIFLVLGIVVVVGSTAVVDLVGAGLLLLSAIGIARWQSDRRRCRGALVILPRTRF